MQTGRRQVRAEGPPDGGAEPAHLGRQSIRASLRLHVQAERSMGRHGPPSACPCRPTDVAALTCPARVHWAAPGPGGARRECVDGIRSRSGAIREADHLEHPWARQQRPCDVGAGHVPGRSTDLQYGRRCGDRRRGEPGVRLREPLHPGRRSCRAHPAQPCSRGLHRRLLQRRGLPDHRRVRHLPAVPDRRDRCGRPDRGHPDEPRALRRKAHQPEPQCRAGGQRQRPDHRAVPERPGRGDGRCRADLHVPCPQQDRDRRLRAARSIHDLPRDAVPGPLDNRRVRPADRRDERHAVRRRVRLR